MISKLVLYQDNTQAIQVQGVTDLSGKPIADAIVMGTLVDRTGMAVPELDNQPFTADTTTPGNYDLTLDSSFAPDVGSYTLQVQGTSTTGDFEVFIAAEVQKRDP